MAHRSRLRAWGARAGKLAGALAWAAVLTLGVVAAARAGVPAPPASAFDLVREAPLTVLVRVTRVTESSDRIEVGSGDVLETVHGTAPEGLRIVARRAFPSDPQVLAEGNTYVAFLRDVPTQSLWKAHHADARARFADGRESLRLIRQDEGAAFASALRRYLGALRDDAQLQQGRELLLDQLHDAPESLHGDAARTLAASPDLGRWLTEARVQRLTRWLGDSRQDRASQAFVVGRLGSAHVERLAAALVDAGATNPALRPALVGSLAALADDSSANRNAALAALTAWRTGADEGTRAALMALAARLGGAESVPYLTDGAIQDPSDDVAAAAVAALATLTHDESQAEVAFTSLGNVARSGRDRAASRAIETLAQAGTARAVSEIEGVFARGRPEIEIVAVMALLNANHPAAFEALNKVRANPALDPRVRLAIDRITGSRSSEPR